MWTHGYVSCERCGYDSSEAEVNEVHVYETDRPVLECPMCRSLACAPVDVDDQEGENAPVLEFGLPEGLTVMSAVAVCDVSNEEGEPSVLVLGGQRVRKVQTLGLLAYAQEMVKERVQEEREDGA